MMKKWRFADDEKKILSTFLSVIIVFSLVLSVIPVTVFAAQSEPLDMQLTSTYSLRDCFVIDSGRGYESSDSILTDSSGNTHSGSIKFVASYNTFASYYLGKEYSLYKGALVAADNTGSGAILNVEIYCDDVLAYSKTDIRKQTPAVSFEIDVSNVNVIIVTWNTGKSNYGDIYIVDDNLIPDPNFINDSSHGAEACRLRDCNLLGSGDGYILYDTLTDSSGKYHDGAVKFVASYNTYAVYDLAKKYRYFKGAFVADINTGSGAVLNVEIYCDNTLAYRKTGITKQMPQVDFEIDVSNARVLKIVSWNTGEYYYGDVYLVDDVLSYDPFSNTPEVAYNGHSYKLYDDSMTWTEAKAFCERIGGHLATITSEEEQSVINQLLLLGSRNSYWVGGYRSSQNSYLWVAGESFDNYTNWAFRQPDRSNEFENSLMVYRNINPNISSCLGEWNDLSENGVFEDESFFGLDIIGFICEWDSVPISEGSKLTSADYLAFSQIAYEDWIGGVTVREGLADKWNEKVWEESNVDVTFSQLCSNISEWHVLSHLSFGGLYGVAFEDENHNVVIAYRGSKALRSQPDSDWYDDWIKTDLPNILNRTLNTNGTIRELCPLRRDCFRVRISDHGPVCSQKAETG